jgi:hypothetical protein
VVGPILALFTHCGVSRKGLYDDGGWRPERDGGGGGNGVVVWLWLVAEEGFLVRR